MLELFDQVSKECSKLVTTRYSTSFSSGIRVFAKEFRDPIYSIYGFVRFADEIVDTFHQANKKELLDRFKIDTFQAIKDGISLNPILNSFQDVVNQYNIDHDLINAFLASMEMDLYKNKYEDSMYKEYIYGSAEVVGLMCLYVFCKGNQNHYNELAPFAKSLGSAFQKVNFLRDMKSDYHELGRVYFPGIDYKNFDNDQKIQIENDIKSDFDHAYIGIIKLPKKVRLGVYLAYIYYTNLFNKIKNSPAAKVKEKRIRVPDSKKLYLLFKSTLKHQFNLM